MHRSMTRVLLAVSLPLVALGVRAGDPPNQGVLIDFSNLPVLANADFTIRLEFDGLKFEPKAYRGPTHPEDTAFIYHNGFAKSGRRWSWSGRRRCGCSVGRRTASSIRR